MDENEKNRLEREKLEIEKQKLDLERQKFEFEKSTTEEGYSVSSNPNLSSTGNSGLSSFFQKYKIAVILSLTILVITCTFYGIHHRGF